MRILLTIEPLSAQKTKEVEEKLEAYIVPMTYEKGQYTTPLFSFQGMRSFDTSSAVLIADLNVTQVDVFIQKKYKAPKLQTFAKSGFDTHGSQNIRVHNSDPFWEAVEEFALGEFGEDARLTYEPGNSKATSPLIVEGQVLVEIVGTIEPKDNTRSRSYAIKVHAMTANLEVKNMAAGTPDVYGESELADQFNSIFGNPVPSQVTNKHPDAIAS